MLSWLRRLLRSRPAGPAAPPRRGGARAAQTSDGLVRRVLAYAPNADGRADPGEVVWAPVAFEDDRSVAKDRPVLVIARKDPWTVLALMLTTQPKRPEQRNWLALGPGTWDRQSRPSWVRLDRVLEVDDRSVRREGAALDRSRYALVARALRDDHGWQYPER